MLWVCERGGSGGALRLAARTGRSRASSLIGPRTDPIPRDNRMRFLQGPPGRAVHIKFKKNIYILN